MHYAIYSGFDGAVKTRGFREAADYTAKLGFDSVEIYEGDGDFVLFESAEDAEAKRRILEEYGLPVICFSYGNNVIRPADPANPGCRQWVIREEAEERLKNRLDVTAALHCPFFHFTLATWLKKPENGPEFEDILEPVVGLVKRLADYAKPLGITLLFEEQGVYFNGTKNFRCFFEKLRAAADNVGVLGDMGNDFFADENPTLFFETFLPYIKHVHMKDFRYQPEPLEGRKGYVSPKGWYITSVRLGTGDAGCQRMMELLREAGYQGGYSLEYTDIEGFEAGVKAGKDLIGWQK